MWRGGGIRGLESAGAGTGEIRGNGTERSVERRGGILDTDGDNRLGPGNPESDAVGVMVGKTGGCRNSEDIPVSGEHERAGVVQGMDGSLEAVAADGLVLEGSVAVPVEVACVPQGAVALPENVDKLAGPEVAGEVSSVHF